jgi:phosphatidylserine/phosphatidylglycerophosphate/cardiolipin synthase-like enzyme
VLHAKFFTVDDVAGVIGSSNMDYRSFGLDYEISWACWADRPRPETRRAPG